MAFYNPSEDSYFLTEVLKEKIKDKKIKVLDLGTGSGIQSQTLIELGISKKNILASDINKSALQQVKKFGVNIIESNLFSKIPEKFDLVIFNPPYLPESEFDNEPDTTGGKNGDEVIVEFIKNLSNHLTISGRAFLLTSSLTPEKKWKKLAKEKGLKITKIATKKIFFEELYIWEIEAQ